MTGDRLLTVAFAIFVDLQVWIAPSGGKNERVHEDVLARAAGDSGRDGEAEDPKRLSNPEGALGARGLHGYHRCRPQSGPRLLQQRRTCLQGPRDWLGIKDLQLFLNAYAL